jgi:hypothetical protein
VYRKRESFLGDSDLPSEDGTLLAYLLARASVLHRDEASFEDSDSSNVESPVEVCPPVPPHC